MIDIGRLDVEASKRARRLVRQRGRWVEDYGLWLILGVIVLPALGIGVRGVVSEGKEGAGVLVGLGASVFGLCLVGAWGVRRSYSLEWISAGVDRRPLRHLVQTAARELGWRVVHDRRELFMAEVPAPLWNGLQAVVVLYDADGYLVTVIDPLRSGSRGPAILGRSRHIHALRTLLAGSSAQAG